MGEERTEEAKDDCEGTVSRMTEDELRRWLAEDPDRALIAYDDGLPVRVRDVPMPISAAQKGLDSTEGAKVYSQYTTPSQSPLEAKFLQLWVMLGGGVCDERF